MQLQKNMRHVQCTYTTTCIALPGICACVCAIIIHTNTLTLVPDTRANYTLFCTLFRSEQSE